MATKLTRLKKDAEFVLDTLTIKAHINRVGETRPLHDGQGLYLRPSATPGSWVWRLRFLSPETGARRWAVIGAGKPYPTTTLAQARKLAGEMRDLVKGSASAKGTGLDPIEEKQRATAEKRAKAQAALLAAQSVRTFRMVFDRWQAVELKPSTKADGKRQGRKDGGLHTMQQFERHIFPALGGRDIKTIGKADVNEILDEHKQAGRLRTANMLLADLKQLLNFAVDRDLIPFNPIATLTKKKVGGADTARDRFLSEAELRALPQVLKAAKLNRRTELALWVMLATGVRLGECMGAVWATHPTKLDTLRAMADDGAVKLGTVNLQTRKWYIFDTKNERDHTIHLSAFAAAKLQALSELRTHDDWVFPDTGNTKPVCVKSLGKQLRDRQCGDAKRLQNRAANAQSLALPGGRWTAHDLRRTCGTTMARLGVSTDVINECQNHMQADRMARVYIHDRREAQQAVAFDKLGEWLVAVERGDSHTATVIEFPTMTRMG